MYGINPILLKQERNDYSEHLSEFDFKLDCSMGSNPYGYWPGLSAEGVLTHVEDYPHGDQELKKAIAQYYASSVPLSDQQIALCCGSIGAMLTVNRMILKEGHVIVGIAPQFSAVVDDFVTYGADYQPVFLKKGENYQFNLQNFLAAMNQHQNAYIYIDNPNNPTGQIIDLSDIKTILDQAKERNSFVVIDEAYGDYMADKQSAMQLVNEYDNLAVIRTFSKAFGAAGLRLGYIIAQEKIIKLLNKVNVPFSMSSVAGYLAMRLLASDWVEQTRVKVQAAKKTLRAGLREIKIAHTSDKTPISLLYCTDESVDLCKVLEQTGLRAITGYGYQGLGINSVRLNVHENMELLMECLHQAETILKK